MKESMYYFGHLGCVLTRENTILIKQITYHTLWSTPCSLTVRQWYCESWESDSLIHLHTVLPHKQSKVFATGEIGPPLMVPSLQLHPSILSWVQQCHAHVPSARKN